jgi:type IV pilus assembly protein PilA
MIKTIKHRMNKSEEEGFTLIELMVVVLILGILMAIAIPTFLSLTSSAKTNAAESDLTTATQDEAVYYTQNGSYDAIAPTAATATDNITGNTAYPGVSKTDPGLNWSATSYGTAGTKTVYVVAATSGQNIILGAAGQNGNVYWVNDAGGTLTYAVTTTAVTTSPVAADFTGHQSWASLSGVTPAAT